MGELSLEETGTARQRTVTWTDPLVGAALARDLSGLEYLRAIAGGRIPAPPIAALLGMSIVSVEPGQVNIVKALTLSTPSVVATGQVVSAGRRVATASGQITGLDGTLYAHATTTCLVFEPRGAKEPPRPGENGHDR